MKIIENVKEKIGKAGETAIDFLIDHEDTVKKACYGALLAGGAVVLCSFTYAYGLIEGGIEGTNNTMRYLAKNFPEETKSIIQKQGAKNFQKLLEAAK